MTQKFVVICGPDMTKEQGIEVFRNLNGKIPYMEVFPEGIMGAERVRTLVRQTVEEGHSMVYMTRYETIINTLGVLIYDGKLTHEQVKIFLVQGEDVSEHRFDEDGFMELGWPFGILA